jgi:hypothetical protein
MSCTYLLACAEGEKHAPAAPPATSATAEATSHGAPLTLRVDGPSQVSRGDTFVLTITLRRSGGEDPVDLDVRLPPEVTLVEGQPSEHVASLGTEPIVRRLRVRLEGSSMSDVVVTAKMRGAAYGASAQAAYRFGRPEPMLSRPELPPVRLGGGAGSR